MVFRVLTVVYSVVAEHQEIINDTQGDWWFLRVLTVVYSVAGEHPEIINDTRVTGGF